MDSQHLLVPIKVQALVIDDSVVKQSGVLQYEGNRYRLNAGRWSPQVYNYDKLLITLNSPGPPPFYGATRRYKGKDADQLILDRERHEEALPQNKDRGVYLHWVLPAGLRRASTPGSLDFPPLPDHWLLVRFSRLGSNLKTRAWFIDGGAVVPEDPLVPKDPLAPDLPTNLLFPGTNNYVGKQVGQVVPLESIATTTLATERTLINAVGNAHTSSPTFTAFIAENRNIFSWHDELEDLRTSDDKIPEGTTLTYCVLGWYRDPQHEPLSSPTMKVVERRDETNKLLGWLIEKLGWSIDANSATTVNLLNRRSVFHGMVAHINYWSTATYKGQMLGYPGAPLVAGSMGESQPAFKVGVGNSAEDALVSLVSSEYSGEQRPRGLEKDPRHLWEALEAVIYRQAETLVKSWNVAPRDMTVHQNSFATHEAGKIWYIRPLAENRGMFPADADKTAAETAARPTPEHLAQLKELNKRQAEVDTLSRDLAALQQDLYMRWWKVCRSDIPQRHKNECDILVRQFTILRDKLDGLRKILEPLPGELKSKLEKEKLELKYDAAPRFWLPADPVIVVKNCGSPDKHQFPSQHLCRLPDHIINSAKVVVGSTTNTINTPTGVADIASKAQRHLPNYPAILNGLLNEASIVEQAVRDLAVRTVAGKTFANEDAWSNWTKELVRFLDKKVTFESGALKIKADSLVDFWVKQPWSPLFIDWKITWFPTTELSTADHPFGPKWNFGKADFVPEGRASIPTQGHTVSGRSLLSPIDDRLFNDPIETLRAMLNSRLNGKQKDTSFPPAVIEVLKRYEDVWSETLSKLPSGGLMGQALTGFHQALLRRDVNLPRITPDSTRPWIANDDEWIENAALKSFENQVRELLDIRFDGVNGERLLPPDTSTASPGISFSLIRSGALRIDELWLIDDFGQYADLLGLTPAGSTSSGQVFHPRMRWNNDRTRFAMPPRVLQPVRLNFRFTAATEETTNTEPALSSICGWIFYNPLDHALVLCNHKGELMGHLVIVKEEPGFRISWEAGAGGVAIDQVANPTLKAFAKSLIQSTNTSKPRLVELLNLIEIALERIRPSGAHRDTILVGRPLALVSASVGLELFGKAWSSPEQTPAERPGTGDPKLDALRVRVNLGYAHSVEDGLIGYYKDSAYNRIVAQLPAKVTASDYVGDQSVHGLSVGFGAPVQLTLLMDPWGSVQASCGIVPAKTITLANSELNKIVAQMEASFRVGPVLLQTDRLALPTPTGNKGTWNFSGPLTEQKAAAVVPLDPRCFSDKPVVAAEGRLLLLNEE